MDAHCSNCATPLTPLWIFCPHCGTAVPHETQNAAPPEHVPARGAFGGLIYGVIAAPILIVAGIMISLTGWGIFLGVPVIVLGILAPLAGPLFGMGEHKGKCPPAEPPSSRLATARCTTAPHAARGSRGASVRLRVPDRRETLRWCAGSRFALLWPPEGIPLPPRFWLNIYAHWT
jgi:hypothetical protein